MPKPTRVVVPPAPQRSDPQGVFSAAVDVFLRFFDTMVSYLDAIADFVDTTAGEVAINAVLPPAQTWVTATAYATDPTDVVLFNGQLFRCAIDHTSGDFATDLAAGRWIVIPGNTFDVNANTLVTLGGVPDAYTLAAASTIQAYATGQLFKVQVNVTNTGAATIDVDGLGPVALEKYDDAGLPVALQAGDLSVGELFDIGYVTDRFILSSQLVREITDQIGLVPIVKKTASAVSQLDFTEFDNSLYEGYQLRCTNISSASGTYLRLSDDGGVNFVDTLSYLYSNRTNIMTGSTLTLTPSAGVVAEVFFCPDGSDGNLVLEFSKLDAASAKTITWSGTYDPPGAFAPAPHDGNAHASITNEVDALRIMTLSSTFSGEFALYGYRKPA